MFNIYFQTGVERIGGEMISKIVQDNLFQGLKLQMYSLTSNLGNLCSARLRYFHKLNLRNYCEGKV